MICSSFYELPEASAVSLVNTYVLRKVTATKSKKVIIKIRMNYLLFRPILPLPDLETAHKSLHTLIYFIYPSLIPHLMQFRVLLNTRAPFPALHSQRCTPSYSGDDQGKHRPPLSATEQMGGTTPSRSRTHTGSCWGRETTTAQIWRCVADTSQHLKGLDNCGLLLFTLMYTVWWRQFYLYNSRPHEWHVWLTFPYKLVTSSACSFK